MPARYPLIALILLLFGWMSAAPASAQTLTPAPFLTFLDNSGKIVNGGCVWTYTAGTTTAATTYTDAALMVANANPIKSDSAGRFVAYLANGASYKFTYENAPCSAISHGTVLKTVDNIAAVPPTNVNLDITGTVGETINAGSVAYLSAGDGGLVAGQWYNASSTNTYSSSTALYVGVAVSTITSGSSGSFRISGRATGLTSLTVGSRYYIAATAGTLTATAPTNSRFVGAADSTTSLVVAPNPAQLGFATYAVGDLLYADTTTSLNKLSDTATGRVLASGGVNTAPTYSASPTLTSVTLTGAPSIDASGAGAGQFKFPATQNASSDAHTLDDYAEGTWTPVDASGAGLTLTTSSAQYIKIGQLVIAAARVTYPATANGSTAILGGLPFTSQSTASVVYACTITYGTEPTAVAGGVLTNSTQLQLTTLAEGNITNATFSTDIEAFTCTYRAAN